MLSWGRNGITAAFKILHKPGRGRRHTPGIEAQSWLDGHPTAPGGHTWRSPQLPRSPGGASFPRRCWVLPSAQACSFCSDNRCHLPSQSEMSEGFLRAYGTNLVFPLRSWSACNNENKTTQSAAQPFINSSLFDSGHVPPSEGRDLHLEIRGMRTLLCREWPRRSSLLHFPSAHHADSLGECNNRSHIFFSSQHSLES